MSQVIERVVFLQGEEANEALEIYEEKGIDAAFDHLKQWHYPGEHETSSEPGHGTSDSVFKLGQYTMAINSPLSYIGLEFNSEVES